MAGLIPITIPQTTPSGDHLKACLNHSSNKSILEALVEIPYLPKFVFHPALLHQFLKAFQPARRKIVSSDRLACGLRRKHAGLEREMNSFQPHRIQESRGIADDQSTVKVVLRLRPITAF